MPLVLALPLMPRCDTGALVSVTARGFIQTGYLTGLGFLFLWSPAIPSALPQVAGSRDGAPKAKEQFCILLPLALSGVISLIALLYFGVRGALCILLISYRDLYSSS